MRIKSILSVTILIMLLIGFGVAFASVQDDGSREIVGKEAPDFTLPVLFEKDVEVTLSELKGEKAVVVDFFATWCGPCRENMPLLDKFFGKHKEEVEVFALTMESDIEMLEDFFSDKKNKVSFRVLLDPGAETLEDYPHKYIPYMVIIGKDGKVVDVHTGYDPDLVKTLEDALGLKSKKAE